MTEKQVTRKLLKVFACMTAWVVVYVTTLVRFVPGWVVAANIVLFLLYVFVTGRELL